MDRHRGDSVARSGRRPYPLSSLSEPIAWSRSTDSGVVPSLAVQAELEAQRQAVFDLRRALEERDEELAAARETNRRLMNRLNRSGG